MTPLRRTASTLRSRLSSARSLTHRAGRAVVAAVLLGTATRPSAAQRLPRAFSVELAPAYQSLGGDDFAGVNGALGIEGLAHYNFGALALGIGYRRHSHGFDFGSAGAELPQGVNVHLKLTSAFLEGRWYTLVDTASRLLPFSSVRLGPVTQSINASARGRAASIEADGILLGAGAGLAYQLTPDIAMLGQVLFSFLVLDQFDTEDEASAGAKVLGRELGFGLGLRYRFRRPNAARRAP